MKKISSINQRKFNKIIRRFANNHSCKYLIDYNDETLYIFVTDNQRYKLPDKGLVISVLHENDITEYIYIYKREDAYILDMYKDINDKPFASSKIKAPILEENLVCFNSYYYKLAFYILSLLVY